MKAALLHRYPADQIKSTNAAFPYLKEKGIDVLTFKTFNRLGSLGKFWKSTLWIFYAPCLVFGKGYDVLYLDDSYPFYPILVKLFSPRSKVVIRLGDLHLMYYYSGLAYRFLHFFEMIGWMMADEVIVISEAMAEYVRKETGRVPEVVLDPVDPLDFPNCDGLSIDFLPSVMFHGTLTENKNVDVLLDAARLMPMHRFTVVGGGPDLERLMKLAPKNVHFQGWVPFKDIHRHIQVHSVGVALRSDNPGNEYVVTSPFLQYGVMGKPCLVTRRKVFGDYKWQFTGAEEMVEKLYELFQERFFEGAKLETYIKENHNAKKIAEEIWNILLRQL